MRCHVVMLLTAIFLAALSRSAQSQDGANRPGQLDVKVMLAVVEPHFNTGSVLHVIIQNISQKPQGHFDEWNSWGYGNLTLQWTDAQGMKGTVTKVARGWDRNAPTTTLLQPGQVLVREISFDSKLWQGWPTINDQTKLTVKVTYHATSEPRLPPAKGDEPGWTGSVTSKEQTILVTPGLSAAQSPEQPH